MERDDAIKILWETARDEKRHSNYDHTVELAKKYYRFTTGDGLDEDMQRFVQRESEAMFEQRKRITKHVIPAVIKNLMDVQYKVPRSNSLTRILEYSGKSQDKKANTLEEILGKFWGDKGFDDYMGIRMVELNNVDPNTFVITEFKTFDATIEHLQPYPFEVTAEMAVNFEFDNNLLQWLIARQIIQFTTSKKDKYGEPETKTGERFTMYTGERAYVLEQIEGVEVKSFMPLENAWYQIAKFYYIRDSHRIFVLKEPEPYNLDHVPARRIGYKRDLKTQGKTYVSPYHDTIPYLEKTLKANSELDLTMAMHAFPQKIIMGRRCPYPECNGGYIYKRDESGKEYSEVCPQCEGVGMLPHTSAQDVIYLPLPDVKEEQLSLDNVIRYVYPPVDLVQFQDEFVEKLTWKAKQTMFNSDIFTREEVAETATGKNIDLQNVYDTLWPFAVKYSDTWEFIVKTIAQLTDMDDGLTAKLNFDKDFKMKTTTELYADLQKANESGADFFAIQDIQMDIARNIFANNPEQFHEYQVKQSFYPFTGKSQEEIMALKMSNTTTQFYKVLEENFSIIFDLIEMNETDFYLLERKKQWEIIKKYTDELIEQINKETPQTTELSGQFE